MWENRKNYRNAEQLYREALQLDPNNPWHNANFAEFVEKVHGDYSQANRLYQLALKNGPDLEWVRTEYVRFQKEHPESSG